MTVKAIGREMWVTLAKEVVISSSNMAKSTPVEYNKRIWIISF
jgi:hypothetical protein